MVDGGVWRLGKGFVWVRGLVKRLFDDAEIELDVL